MLLLNIFIQFHIIKIKVSIRILNKYVGKICTSVSRTTYGNGYNEDVNRHSESNCEPVFKNRSLSYIRGIFLPNLII